MAKIESIKVYHNPLMHYILGSWKCIINEKNYILIFTKMDNNIYNYQILVRCSENGAQSTFCPNRIFMKFVDIIKYIQDWRSNNE